MRKLLLLCLVAACGGNDSIAFSDLPDSIIDARCANDVACEAQPDTATCLASNDIDPGEIDSIQNAIDAGTIIYDEDAGAACVDSINSQGCTFEGFHTGDDNPCADMFQGTVAAGGACTLDLECESLTAFCEPTDPQCDPDTACCPGTCVDEGGGELPDVAIGGTCGDNTGPCVANSYCSFPDDVAPTGTCKALITTEGAACDSSFASCSGTMICDLLFADPPTCQQPAASGAACDEMDLIPCIDSRDHCSAGTCTPNVDVGGACPLGFECVGFATCVAGTCQANPGAGDTCVVDGEVDCLGVTDCVGGTCQLPPASTVCN